MIFFQKLSTLESLPYGQKTFHLATIFNTLANPIGATSVSMMTITVVRKYFCTFISIFLNICHLKYHSNYLLVFVLSLISSSWLILLATQAPCPVLVDTLPGSIMVVTVLTIFSLAATIVKVHIANELRSNEKHRSYKQILAMDLFENRFCFFKHRSFGKIDDCTKLYILAFNILLSKYLLWYGAVTQVGSLCGAVFAFILDQHHVFLHRDACHSCAHVDAPVLDISIQIRD